MCRFVNQLWFRQVFSVLIVSFKVYFVEVSVGRCDDDGFISEPFSLGKGLVEDPVRYIVQVVFNLA